MCCVAKPLSVHGSAPTPSIFSVLQHRNVGCIKLFHHLQIWVAEPTGREDLCTLVLAYLQGTVPHPPVDNAVNFYQAAKTAAVRLHAFHHVL